MSIVIAFILGLLIGSYKQYWQVYRGARDDLGLGPDYYSLSIKHLIGIHFTTGHLSKDTRSIRKDYGMPDPKPRFVLFVNTYKKGRLVNKNHYLIGRPL